MSRTNDTMTPDVPVLIHVTCPDEGSASQLAAALVDTRQAACVNIVPGVQSVYRWQGRIETDSEWLLLAKTRKALLPDIKTTLTDLHPDDVPELIAIDITAGSRDYLDWLVQETTP